MATVVWLWALCCGEGVGDSASERRSSQGQGQGYSAAESVQEALIKLRSHKSQGVVYHPEVHLKLETTLSTT